MSEGERLTELAKRRGFYFPAAGAYGGAAGFWTYGPQGAALKSNVEDAWRDRFVLQEGHQEISAPDVMPEAVFEASGHLDGFDDMIIECGECGATHRADHIVEDNTDIEEAESLPNEDVMDIIADHDIACPSCNASLAGEPVDNFNLMFATNIGPGTSSPGYLRPETAQGIFVEFPQLSEYARNQLPFGVAQIGKAYRNEISPRKSLVRVREFTQAELEHFVDPEEDEPPLADVEDVTLPLYSGESQQAADGGVEQLTVGEAVDEGVVTSDWVAYYLGVARDWYERIGIDMDRFRFRQHLPGELAHYAADCWDAEAEIDGDWIEITGFAYRGDYDLQKHAEHSGEDYTVFKQYDEPVTVERPTVDPDMSYLGPEFGGDAQSVADALEALAERDPEAFEGEDVTVEVDGEAYTVPVEETDFSVETVTENGEHVRPHVVEPSFGVGRLIYTMLAHAYTEDEVDGEERTYLDLPPEQAPTTVGVFPLMDKDGMAEYAREIASALREAGHSVTYDDSGAIGRRYRRQDEIGTPYCVTVDYESVEEDTVTVRERDSTEQKRVSIDGLAETIARLTEGETTFDDL
ncbi:glycine--tRNA ligase [Haloarcula pellucida]|uniref:glycine--tRNA ligase n=1 Tax=Haloarcula pellucida TaxID=1427151 RepID=A0A830GQL2_9EURY|nr:glycine--tRNA ligase [Halomicroarcula pellucida]MBX0349455.1 glycine--tRNA ligase [Halomicroarcula pellucida]GGO02859.1 glycine--tRNA ligase [Halomicroarcula pellucida]